MFATVEIACCSTRTVRTNTFCNRHSSDTLHTEMCLFEHAFSANFLPQVHVGTIAAADERRPIPAALQDSGLFKASGRLVPTRCSHLLFQFGAAAIQLSSGRNLSPITSRVEHATSSPVGVVPMTVRSSHSGKQVKKAADFTNENISFFSMILINFQLFRVKYPPSTHIAGYCS